MSDSKHCKFCNQGYFDCGGPYYFGQDVECVNGVLIDIDEAHEGWQPDVCYPLAPCHPNYETQEPNDSDERLAAWASLGEAAMTHDNVTDIVERDHIKETTETLFRIAINATMPKENEAKWCQALQYAGAMLEKQQADLATLRKQLENAREALRQWEEWETKWIEDARCWVTNDGSHIPQDMFDEYVCGPQNAREALKGQP